MPFLVVYVLLCLLVAIGGKSRPFGFWGYFFGSLLLTPAVGVILLAAAGNNRVRHPSGY
jgi:uncharacterized membrane protein